MLSSRLRASSSQSELRRRLIPIRPLRPPRPPRPVCRADESWPGAGSMAGRSTRVARGDRQRLEGKIALAQQTFQKALALASRIPRLVEPRVETSWQATM